MSITVADEPVTLAVAGLCRAIEALDLEAAAGLDEPVVVVQGFPYLVEFGVPRITVEPGQEDWRRCMMHDSLSVTDGPGVGEVTVTYRTHRITLPVQCDVWTGNKTDRFKILPHLVDLFGPDVDALGNVKTAGLEYTLVDHHGALVVVHWLSGRPLDRDGIRDGIFRYSATLRVELHRYKTRVLSAADWHVEQTVTTDQI